MKQKKETIKTQNLLKINYVNFLPWLQEMDLHCQSIKATCGRKYVLDKVSIY